ncbi:MAG: TldD/PmbA family protein [Peptostreptococcus sp.]|uniref:TldD/PmbA family protein n=1 Tax=Peptostreptococcus sp. TaxID=1262 RepID=UPI002FC8B53F
MLDKKVLFNVITSAMQNGADFAEVFVEDRKNTTLLYSDKKVENAVLGNDFGVGIRVIKAFNTVYAYTNDISEENLIKVAKDAALGLKSSVLNQVLDFTNKNIVIDNTPIKIYPSDVDLSKKLDIIRETHDTIMNYDDIIVQASTGYLDSDQKIQIANSEGLMVSDRRVRTRLIQNAVASYNGEIQSAGSNPGAAMGFEFFDTIDINDVAREAARIAVTMVKSPFAPSGVMPVIMDNAFGGVLFHEACGHGLEAEFVSKGSSVYAGKMGEKIASDVVTAVDDGTLKNQWGSSNIDDEGTATQRNTLIENGVLKSYLVDNLNGKRMGMESTGSARRQSYRYAPTSRMNNTFIDRGTSSFDDMVSGVDHGLYAAKLGGGSVDVVTGEFNFAVMEGYIIKNGKIDSPVKGASLVGTGLEVLQKIDMVGKDLELGEGMCGASSGTIPAGVGQPPVRIKGLTVGGRD